MVCAVGILKLILSRSFGEKWIFLDSFRLPGDFQASPRHYRNYLGQCNNTRQREKQNNRNSRGHSRALKPFLPKQTRNSSRNLTCRSKIGLIFSTCIVCGPLRGITDLTLGSRPNSAHSAALAAASFQNNLLKSQKKHSDGVNLHPLGEIAKTQGPGCLFKGQEERGSI